MKKAIVLNPHNDDAIIGIGGTLIQLLEKNWKIMYVQMTDGRRGSENVSPDKLRKIRIKEGERERNYLGIHDFYNFDIKTLRKINKRKIIGKLIEIIKQYQPNVIFFPAKTEVHATHLETHKLAKRAMREINFNPLEIHYIVWFLPFLKQDPGGLERILKIPIDKWFNKKRTSIKLHVSQEKRGNLSKLTESINSYFSLIYPRSRDKKCKKSEVVGIYKVNKNYNLFIKDLEGVMEVTKISHGKRFKNKK